MTASVRPLSEREQTDDSLRAEREKADRALEEEAEALDAAADAVVTRARARADAVLAAARMKTDRSDRTPRPEALRRSRALEDHILQDERASADDILRDERAEHIALLSHERQDTDRDLFNERSRADHALAIRDEFMSIVSHDLQNMLNGMVGVASLIEAEAARDNQVAQVITHARRIQRSGARMHRLIGDLVDVASIEAGMMAVTREVCDPASVVNEAVDTFQPQAGGSGVSLAAEIVPPLPLVAFDPARILQVLSNLLSNAIKFTPPRGSVVVRVEHVGDDILFAVRDTGAGVPVDKLEAVFERFVQLTKNDRRGVGLGLYISRSIVHGHAGRIWADSRGAEGSAFCFTLPVQRAV
jgi:signal transduction histidine kinase